MLKLVDLEVPFEGTRIKECQRVKQAICYAITPTSSASDTDTTMAPRVEPKSLHKLSIAAVSLAVDSACTDIFLEHGCYGNEVREGTKTVLHETILLIVHHT